jgi:hypothetical protein
MIWELLEDGICTFYSLSILFGFITIDNSAENLCLLLRKPNVRSIKSEFSRIVKKYRESYLPGGVDIIIRCVVQSLRAEKFVGFQMS